MKTKRIISTLLCLVMVLCMLPTGIVSAETETIRILTCSDFQHPTGYQMGKMEMIKILDAMKADGITTADGLFAAGDYDYGYNLNSEGIAAIKEAVSDMVTTDELVFVQGNHDGADTVGLSPSGNNDPESGAYGVYVIHEDDYMWYGADTTTVKSAAINLEKYLNEKLEADFDKPIFVITHLPLHYNMRTYNDGDGMHANFIFDVLNQAGAQGLNITFLFGHNHSGGWDDYIGGASVFLKKGDKINIPTNSKKEYEERTLNFTYMTAGYVGYYNAASQADDVMSMCVIEITDDTVTFKRYTEDGLHDLKAAGVKHASQTEPYKPDKTVYTSPQTIDLSSITDKTNINVFKPATEGEKYVRLAAKEDVKDGGKYLLIVNSSMDQIMVPTVIPSPVNNMRIEFIDEVSFDEFFGDYADKRWTFTASEGKWIISDNNGNQLKTTNGTAELAEEGSLFSVGGKLDSYTIKGGTNYLYYNAEKDILVGNGRSSSKFIIYEFQGCSVVVDGGTASKDLAFENEEITITADAAPEGKVFDKWVVNNGDIDLDDATSETATFTMPDGAVNISATYKNEGAADYTPGDVNNDGEIDVSDAVMLVEYVGTLSIGEELDPDKFPGGTLPGGEESAILTADNVIDISDIVLLVEYIGTLAIGEELDPDKFPGGTFPGANL